MSDQTDMREVRRKKLDALYGQYLSLLTYEGTLVSARFAHAIATQTIFFAAYFVVTSSGRLEGNIQYVVQVAISLCSLLSLIVYALILARTSVAATAWRASLTLIEEDEDFWYPANPNDFVDLDIFGSRSRALRGVETRQQHVVHAVTSKRFKLILFMGSRVRDPIDFYAMYFPAFFFVVWISLFVVSTHHAVGSGISSVTGASQAEKHEESVGSKPGLVTGPTAPGKK